MSKVFRDVVCDVSKEPTAFGVFQPLKTKVQYSFETRHGAISQKTWVVNTTAMLTSKCAFVRSGRNEAGRMYVRSVQGVGWPTSLVGSRLVVMKRHLHRR
jgi:hypothetical protein